MHRVSLCPRVTGRRGIALLTAVIAIVIVGALIAGAFFPATEELRLGAQALEDQRALVAAERGAALAISTWDRTNNVRSAPGAAWGPDTLDAGDGAASVVRVLRTTPHAFWLTSEGIASLARAPASGRRLIGVALRLAMPVIASDAAFTVRGALDVRGAARIDGADRAPSELRTPCVPDESMVGGVGVDAPDSTRVCSAGGCGAASGPWITGAPPVRTTPRSADSTTYGTFGDLTWAALAHGTDVTLPAGAYRAAPVIAGGTCRRDGVLNWGDPRRATLCADYYPVIVIRGDATLRAGSVGQGILLVDGDLHLEGDARFDGVIVVRDDMTAFGVGARVTGAVYAANRSSGDDSWLAGDVVVQRSQCVVQRALLGAATLTRVRERAWVELFR